MTRLSTLVQPHPDLERLWSAEREFLAAIRHLSTWEAAPALEATVAELQAISEEIVRHLDAASRAADPDSTEPFAHVA